MYHFITDLSSDDFLEEESTIKVINTVKPLKLDRSFQFSIIFKK